jgi:hypothetical protein
LLLIVRIVNHRCFREWIVGISVRSLNNWRYRSLVDWAVEVVVIAAAACCKKNHECRAERLRNNLHVELPPLFFADLFEPHEKNEILGIALLDPPIREAYQDFCLLNPGDPNLT